MKTYVLTKTCTKIFIAALFITGASLVAQMVKNLTAVWETQVQSLGWKDPLEKGMAAHTSILIWRITWTEETGRLQSMGSQRIGHDRVTNTLSIIELFRGFSGLKNEIPAATCCHLSCVRYCTLHFFFLSSNH